MRMEKLLLVGLFSCSLILSACGGDNGGTKKTYLDTTGEAFTKYFEDTFGKNSWGCVIDNVKTTDYCQERVAFGFKKRTHYIDDLSKVNGITYEISLRTSQAESSDKAGQALDFYELNYVIANEYSVSDFTDMFNKTNLNKWTGGNYSNAKETQIDSVTFVDHEATQFTYKANAKATEEADYAIKYVLGAFKNFLVANELPLSILE